MPTGYVRGALESEPGNEVNTPTLSTKKLFAPLEEFQPTSGVAHLDRDSELRNTDEPLARVPESYSPSWSMSVRAYPDVLGFFLTHLLGEPTTAAGDGAITDQDSVAIPTGAYRHRWVAPFGPSGASPATAQFDIAYKDQSAFFKMKGAALAEVGLTSPEEGGAMLALSGPACYLDDQSDPSLTPAYESLSIRPFLRGDLSLPSWLSGTGRHEDFSLSVANPVEAVRSLGVASLYPDAMEKANEGPIVVTGSLSQRQLDVDDWNALIAATGFAATARWASRSIIASSYPYKLYVVMDNAQYTGGDPEALGNKRRHGASFEFISTTDSSGSTTIELVNATAAYDIP